MTAETVAQIAVGCLVAVVSWLCGRYVTLGVRMRVMETIVMGCPGAGRGLAKDRESDRGHIESTEEDVKDIKAQLQVFGSSPDGEAIPKDLRDLGVATAVAFERLQRKRSETA